MSIQQLNSWARYPKAEHLGVIEPAGAEEARDILMVQPPSILPRGLGRSYGDSCLNDQGYLLLTSSLKRVLSFDSETGVIRCESGLTLDELLRYILPNGWFLPVTPGTKFVTVGGAIANDVHGKNHHRSGSFGNHVLTFELLRSDGSKIRCSRTQNIDWFRATIGGLGLTGLILWAEIQLKAVSGPYVNAKVTRFVDLSEFASLSRNSKDSYEYTVAWIDSLATGKSLGRGAFIEGNHSEWPETNPKNLLHATAGWKKVPWDMPSFVLSPLSVRLFNQLYYFRQKWKAKAARVHYDPFFYPLDGIHDWNRMYGRRGFIQWQCVIPFDAGYACMATILSEIAKSRLGSFLVVMKEFGSIPAEGLLSFPSPGITLAMDFANVGLKLSRMLDRLDAIVVEAKGRVYPAKDARMSAKTFQMSFPHVSTFTDYVDPKFSSSFWRRVSKPPTLR